MPREPAAGTTDPKAPDETLETDLIGVVNRHIRTRNLHPGVAAETLAAMAAACLRHLAWSPPNAQAARASLHDAIGHLRRGA